MTTITWIQPVAEIPEQGLRLEWTATPAEREALAKALEVVAVGRVSLVGRIEPNGRGRYRLSGQLTGEVTQACVVTLDPVASALDIDLDIELVPAAELPNLVGEGAEDADPVAAPIAEAIRNGSADLGEIVFQELAAALDPYPRAPGAELERTEALPPDDPSTNPFAKLQSLAKPRPER